MVRPDFKQLGISVSYLDFFTFLRFLPGLPSALLDEVSVIDVAPKLLKCRDGGSTHMDESAGASSSGAAAAMFMSLNCLCK